MRQVEPISVFRVSILIASFAFIGLVMKAPSPTQTYMQHSIKKLPRISPVSKDSD